MYECVLGSRAKLADIAIPVSVGEPDNDIHLIVAIVANV